MNATIQIRITPKLHKKLKALCGKTRKTFAEVIEDLIK